MQTHTHTCFSHTSSKPYTNTESFLWLVLSVLVQEFILLGRTTKIRCLYVFHMDPCSTHVFVHVYIIYVTYMLCHTTCLIKCSITILSFERYNSYTLYRLLPNPSCWGLWNAVQYVVYSFFWGDVTHSTKSNRNQRENK
jgi:hypothetical protein